MHLWCKLYCLNAFKAQKADLGVKVDIPQFYENKKSPQLKFRLRSLAVAEISKKEYLKKIDKNNFFFLKNTFTIFLLNLYPNNQKITSFPS